MKACAFSALLWCAAAERDDESFMLQSKQASSLATDFDGDEWSLCNTKVTSNLGGYVGTSQDTLGVPYFETNPEKPGEMRFWEVGKVNGQLVDLRLKNTSKYTPNDRTLNGREGCFAQLNVKADTDVKIVFSLVKTGTDTVVGTGPKSAKLKQNFTIVEFDRSNLTERGRGRKKVEKQTTEQVWAKDFANVGDTRLPDLGKQEAYGEEWYVFEAAEDAIEIPYPGDISVDALPADKLKATLSLTYVEKNEWELLFKAVTNKEKGQGRNFLFAGETSSCDVAPVCMCTPDEKLRNPRRLDHYLRWDMCNTDPVRGNGHVLRYPNVATLRAADGTMEAGEQAVDLIVDNMTEYAAFNPERNGRVANGCLGVINLQAPGSATMRFTLVYAGTDEAVPVRAEYPLTYDFNVFDFDQSASGQMQEMIGVSGFSKLVARPPGIVRSEPDDSDITWLHTTTPAVDNPKTDIRKELDSDQIASSFSVSYRGQSSWDIDFKAEAEGESKRKGGRNFLFSGESCASWRYHECTCPREKRRFRAKQ